jgi:hypothetical protein
MGDPIIAELLQVLKFILVQEQGAVGSFAMQHFGK